MPVPPTSDQVSKQWLVTKLLEIENHVDADLLFIFGPIMSGVDHRVRQGLEDLDPRHDSLLVILDTPGGIVEVVERIVTAVRHHYPEVKFLIPDRAMSAGTVLAMSGDAILMDHFSCLGPVDPQVERDGRLVPALSYLAQYKRFIERAENGELTSAELALLQDLDLAELHQFELAAELSVELIKNWLVKYKFKDWKKTEGKGKAVTKAMKERRADQIARELNKHDRWLTHGRGLGRDVLDALNLRIDPLEDDPTLALLARDYFHFFREYLLKNQVLSFVHTRTYF